MFQNPWMKIVSDWIASAKHPKLKRKYTDLTYQPMKELIAYLQDCLTSAPMGQTEAFA
jgi:hypothetical protein